MGVWLRLEAVVAAWKVTGNNRPKAGVVWSEFSVNKLTFAITRNHLLLSSNVTFGRLRHAAQLQTDRYGPYIWAIAQANTPAHPISQGPGSTGQV